MIRQFILRIVLLAALHLVSPIPTMAHAAADSRAIDPLGLEQQEWVGNATSHIGFLIDRIGTISIGELVAEPQTFAFAPIRKPEPNFGFEHAPIWLRLKLRNTDDNALERILVMRTNFVSEIDVWHEQGGILSKVLEQDLSSPFSTRPIDYHQLAAPLRLEPGADSTVWIRYRTTGITAMPIAVETNMSFTTRSNREMAWNFAFYGVMVVLMFASLLALVLTRVNIFLWYLFYSGFVTFYLFHRDGYAFQMLWREYGWWNSYASLPLAGLLTIFAAQFTRAYLNTRADMRQLDRVLVAAMIVQAASIAASAVFDSEPIKQLMTISIPISAIIFLCAGVIGLARNGWSGVAFVLGWTGIVAASAVTFIAHWVDLEVTRAATLDTMRTAMVFDAVMMGIACFNVVMEWRQERENLLQERIAAAERNAVLRGRLDLLERRYEAAQVAAENSSKLVANTTHDLRQPLFALRSSILKLSSQPSSASDDLGQVEASLAYMESLVENGLSQAMEITTSVKSDAEETPAQRVLDTVSVIFAEDAEAAGIELEVIPSDAVLCSGTGDVLRVMSNLVSNALAYSGGSRITIAARSTDGAIEFSVTDDGRGMDRIEVPSLAGREARGDDASLHNPEGKGLGLSIVAEIAEKLGGSWHVASAPGAGTRATLLVPAAA